MEAKHSIRSGLSERELVTVGILAGGALCFRLLFMGCRSVLSGDELHYAESLFHFMKGSFLAGISDYWSFFYPLAGVPFGLIAGDAETGLRFLSAVSGAALVVPGWAIARKLWGGRAAVFAGALLAVHPNLLSLSTAAMTESLFSLLFLTALWLFLSGTERSSGRSFGAAGLFLGLAYLTRPEAIFLAVVLAAAAAAGWGGGGLAAPRAVRARRAILFAVFFVAAALPYFFLLHAGTGRWTGGSKAAVNLSSPLVWRNDLAREEYVYSLDAEGSARRIDETGRESAASVLWRQKGAIASRYPGNLAAGFDLATVLLTSPFLLLLVPLGLAGGAARKDHRGASLLLMFFGIFPFLFYALFRVELRYLGAYLPIHLLWAGAGCVVLADWFREAVSPKRSARVILFALVFGSLVPYAINKYVVTARSEPVEWREIGRWIRVNEGENARILAKPGCSISYYAGNPMATFIPWTDEAGLVRFARLNRFEYVAVDEEYIRAMRPALRPLVEKPSADFRTVREFTSESGGRIVLYRVDPSS